MINEHYKKRGGPEPKDVINAWDLNFNKGNIVKYAYRAGLKPGNDELDDLMKIKEYAQFEIDRVLADRKRRAQLVADDSDSE